MFTFYVIILHLLIVGSIASDVSYAYGRIYNGTVSVNEGLMPYMVFIILGLFHRTNTEYSTCSGSLIKFDTVMTAAHCLTGRRPENVVVMVGKANATDYLKFRQRNPIRKKYPSRTIQDSLALKLHMHPRYVTNKNYDLGIIKVAEPFTETRHVDIIKYTTDLYSGQQFCLIAGYGSSHLGTSATLMYFTTSDILNNTILCGSRWYDPEYYCLKTHDQSACIGDSGGPMVCNLKVYGVISYIEYSNVAEEGCGYPGIIKFFKLSLSDDQGKFLNTYFKNLSSKLYEVAPQWNVLIHLYLTYCLCCKL